MNVVFKKSFLKDLKKVKDDKLKNAIYECISNIESAEKVEDIKNLKKLTGYQNYYRIRLGQYRMGIKMEDNTLYIVCFDHRKDIYTSFP